MLGSLILLVCYAPPVIRVDNNQTTIVQNGTVIILGSDGSIKITGPSIDLSLSGNDKNPEPIFPPDLPIVTVFQKKFNEDKATLEQKSASLKELVKLWEKASVDVTKHTTTGEFQDALKAMSKPLGVALIGLRTTIGQELIVITSKDEPITPELLDKLKSSIDSVVARLKGVK